MQRREFDYHRSEVSGVIEGPDGGLVHLHRKYDYSPNGYRTITDRAKLRHGQPDGSIEEYCVSITSGAPGVAVVGWVKNADGEVLNVNGIEGEYEIGKWPPALFVN
jgi:hypothetical protein